MAAVVIMAPLQAPTLPWGVEKKGAMSWRPVREIAREEIANLSSFVVAAPPMVQWAPIRH